MKIITSKTTALLVTLLTFTLLALTGCSTTADKQEAAPAKTTQSAATQTSSDASTKEGLAKLLKTARQLNKAAVAGDEAKIREYGPKLEENWSGFEDAIKSKYPEIYEQVEKSLNPIVAGTKTSVIDKDAILKLNNQLIQVLYDLSQKLIPLDQVKAGVTQLIGLTHDMAQAIDTGNETKIKEIGPKLEDMWSTFEDGLKPRNPDLYEEVEKSLNPEVAGSQKTPVDKQTLATLNTNLTQTLIKLGQNLK